MTESNDNSSKLSIFKLRIIMKHLPLINLVGNSLEEEINKRDDMQITEDDYDFILEVTIEHSKGWINDYYILNFVLLEPANSNGKKAYICSWTDYITKLRFLDESALNRKVKRVCTRNAIKPKMNYEFYLIEKKAEEEINAIIEEG